MQFIHSFTEDAGNIRRFLTKPSKSEKYEKRCTKCGIHMSGATHINLQVISNSPAIIFGYTYSRISLSRQAPP